LVAGCQKQRTIPVHVARTRGAWVAREWVTRIGVRQLAAIRGHVQLASERPTEES
jgi:hypothetical protein